MALHPGDTAPDFTLKTQDDKDWKLSDHKGKNVVLLWYPLDWSPTCEKENCKISQEPILAGPNTVVVGISRDSTWSHKAWKAAKGIKHDLLADPMLDVTKKFGLAHPAVPFISHRATVIVDKHGKVAFCQVQENTKEERNWSEVQAALKKLG
jgi:peroxiredoxin